MKLIVSSVTINTIEAVMYKVMQSLDAKKISVGELILEIFPLGITDAQCINDSTNDYIEATWIIQIDSLCGCWKIIQMCDEVSFLLVQGLILKVQLLK